MLSLDECKKYIGELGLSDSQIEEVRDLLHSFVEQVLDYGVDQGMFVTEMHNEK